MRTLYESILDSDDHVLKRGKTALIQSFVNVVSEHMPDMIITFTPDKSTIVGTVQISLGTGSVINKLGNLKNSLEKRFPDNVTYNRTALQVHVNIPYDKDLIRCSFVFTRIAVGHILKEGILMNIQADKQKTLNVIKKIFDKTIPF